MKIPPDVTHAVIIAPNVVSLLLNLWIWHPGISSAVGLAVPAIAVAMLIYTRQLLEAHLAQLDATTRKRNNEADLAGVLLEKVRAGEVHLHPEELRTH